MATGANALRLIVSGRNLQRRNAGMCRTCAFRKQSQRSTSPRRGIVTAMVVVVLILLSGLIVEFARRAVDDRRQMRTELEYSQALELAQAGILRAEQIKKTDQGDVTLDIPQGVVHQTKTAQVVISVDRSEATVTATYPNNLERPLKVTRSVSF